MARPKEFERDKALQAAIDVFADHGFEGSSTDGLLKAMGISRQSLYDTFGDKWKLYLEALQRYSADSIGEQVKVLNAGTSALAGIEAHLMHMVDTAAADANPKCLGIGAVCEFGRHNAAVTQVSEIAGTILSLALEKRLAEAKEEGSVDPDLDVAEASGFIQSSLAGIKIAARGGASAQALRGIARMTLRGLR